jgi:hypothetical protein
VVGGREAVGGDTVVQLGDEPGRRHLPDAAVPDRRLAPASTVTFAELLIERDIFT